jgi:hypothetical protein
MTTSSACDTKIFRPLPSYSVCSLLASKSNRRVGSRFSRRGFLPPFVPEREDARVGDGAAACALEDGVDDPINIGISSYATASRATAPSTAAHVVCFLFSNPSCTYDLAFKYVSSFMPNLTGPCVCPPRVTLLMMKNISSRSSALMNRAREL